VVKFSSKSVFCSASSRSWLDSEPAAKVFAQLPDLALLVRL
jgi:hypothetical protein